MDRSITKEDQNDAGERYFLKKDTRGLLLKQGAWAHVEIRCQTAEAHTSSLVRLPGNH